VLDEDIWNTPDVLPHAIPVAGRDDAAKFSQSIASTWEGPDTFELDEQALPEIGDGEALVPGGVSVRVPPVSRIRSRSRLESPSALGS